MDLPALLQSNKRNLSPRHHSHHHMHRLLFPVVYSDIDYLHTHPTKSFISTYSFMRLDDPLIIL